MKTLVSSIALALLANSASAQNQAVEPPLVSTTGSAEIKVVPDLADLSFEVEVRNADLAIARKDQSERAKKVLAAIRAAGVEEADLQASQLSIAPNYTQDRRDSGETDKVRFFSVSQTVSFTLKDIKKVPDVVAAVVTAGATGMSGVGLRSSELRKHRDQARAMAVRAAREKADALAKELGAKAGKPYRISEEPSDGWGYNRGNSNFQIGANAIDGVLFGGEGGPAFAPGTISISAKVGVSFLIE